MEKLVYSLAETAEILDISIPTLRKCIRNGTVPHITFGKKKICVPVAALERILSEAGKSLK